MNSINKTINLDTKLKKLNSQFYNNYRSHAEILNKDNRPYCFIFLSINNINFAVPFRTNIKHQHSYLFTGSPRGNNSGLDFSKAVVIKESKYIGKETMINSFEYNVFIKKRKVIANRFEKFINNYIKWSNDPKHYKQEMLFKFTSLKYFHSELGIK